MLSEEKNVKWPGWPEGGVRTVLRVVNLNTNGISQLTTFYRFVNRYSVCIHPCFNSLLILPQHWEQGGVKSHLRISPPPFLISAWSEKPLTKHESIALNFNVLAQEQECHFRCPPLKRVKHHPQEVSNKYTLLRQVSFLLDIQLTNVMLHKYFITANIKASCRKINSNIHVLCSESVFSSLQMIVAERRGGAKPGMSTGNADTAGHTNTKYKTLW